MEWWHEWSLCHSGRPATVLRVWLPLPPWLDRGVVALQAPLSSSTVQSFRWTRTKGQWDLLVILYSPSAEHVQSVKIYWSYCTVLLPNTYKVSRRSTGNTVQSFCWTRTKCQGDLLVTLHSPSAEHVQSVKEIGWSYCTVLLLNTYKVSRRSTGHTAQSFCRTRTKCQGDLLVTLHSPSAEHVQSVKEIYWSHCTVLLPNTYKVSRRSTGHTAQSFCWTRTKCQGDLLVTLHSPSAEHVQSVKEIYWSHCTVLLLNTYKVSRRSTGHTAQSFCWTRTKCQGDLLVTLHSPSAEHVQSVKEIYWSHCTVLLPNTYKVSRRSTGHTAQSFCWTRTKCQGDLLVTLHSPSAEHVQSVKEIYWSHCTVLLLNTYKVSRRSTGHTAQSFCRTRTKCQGDLLVTLHSPSAEHVQSVKEIYWSHCTVLLLNTYKVSRRSAGHTVQSFCWTRTKCQGDRLVMMGCCCCCFLCFVVVVVVVFACLFVFVLGFFWGFFFNKWHPVAISPILNERIYLRLACDYL